MNVLTDEYKIGLDFVWAYELLDDNLLPELDKLDKYRPLKLLEEFEKVIDKEGHINNKKYYAIKAKFADDLHLISRQVLSAILEEDLGEIWKKLNELEKNFKQHRHKKDPSYSEKPSW